MGRSLILKEIVVCLWLNPLLVGIMEVLGKSTHLSKSAREILYRLMQEV